MPIYKDVYSLKTVLVSYMSAANFLCTIWLQQCLLHPTISVKTIAKFEAVPFELADEPEDESEDSGIYSSQMELSLFAAATSVCRSDKRHKRKGWIVPLIS